MSKILAPPPGTKLRPPAVISVHVTAVGSDGVEWTLSLIGPDDTREIARGVGAVDAQPIAEISGEFIEPGTEYELQLLVSDGDGVSIATSSVMRPEKKFTLIPLYDVGPLRKKPNDVLSVSDDGDVLFSSDRGTPVPATIIRRGSAQRQALKIDLSATEGVKLSGDGQRVFYRGHYSSRISLGYLDVSSGLTTQIARHGGVYFSVDRLGQRVAYQEPSERAEPHKPDWQYILFEASVNERRQLTDVYEAIDRTSDCPSENGSTPQISADGSTIVFLTSSTLGIVPDDPTVGCRVFAYDVPTQEMRLVASLPSRWHQANYPSLSGDGRWLSFPVVEVKPTGGSRGIPVLVDVDTGDVTAPIVDTGNFTNFDSTITRDGSQIIFSSQADLDPRVGNSDHNLEVFILDRSTGDIRQISETVGGIDSRPAGCETYQVRTSADGSVMAFGFPAFDVESCRLDGPQISEDNGLWLARVRAVRKRDGNREVVFDQIEEQRIEPGETLDLTLHASDADGDLITFFAQVPGTLDIIPGSNFVDQFDGTARFEWTPRVEDSGTHLLRVVAYDDGGGEQMRDLRIIVGPAGEERFCGGACTNPDAVGVDDLLLLVNISLGMAAAEECPEGDMDANGQVTVDEILAAVSNALAGCNE